MFVDDVFVAEGVVDSVAGSYTSFACGHVALAGDPDCTCRTDSVPQRENLVIWGVEAYHY